MTQDMNHTIVNALRAVIVAAMMPLTGSHALAQESSQTSSGTGVHVMGNVYGGGNFADVGGNVTVNMSAGTVDKDVYGGGALANTNINNATDYNGTGTEANSFTYSTTVNLTGGKIYGDAYGGGLGQMGTAVEGVHWTQEEIDAATDASNPAYGKTTSDWKVEPVAAGADGAGAVKAKVYGNVNVNLGSSASGSSATAFWITNYSGDHSGVVKSGRVFGCNNLNGSPLGNVTVTVYKTVEGNSSRSETADKNSTNATYELAAVYGGGNLANYTASGKKTHVIINGCSDTSVEYVYGGGNAAAVPEASVDVNAAYEIGYVFGGGNGKDQYTLDDGTSWNTNPGANVNGNTTTMLYGGTIHEAFGGSNEKGTISGTVSINTSTNADCALRLGKLYGAGKNADIEGDLIVTLGCMPGDENPTDEVYGGAENANVKGNVELTITSGTFHKVFGGNNTSGAIFGHIKLNIEETGCCPIKIDELYLGGYNAPYSVYGYYQEGTIPGTDKPNYVAIQSASDNTHTAVYFTSNDHTRAPYADPELNIISCTRIGKVFGGGLGSGAVIYGNPTVNINQIYGIKADGSGGYTAKATTLGEIGGQYILDGETVNGGVFGGGNQASVIGNTTVNIGTLPEVDPVTTPVDQTANTNSHYDVVGANIVGNVYGGGNLADVTGNTFVYVCAVEGDDPATTDVTEEYTAVSIQGTNNVTIGGNVFGGGKGEAKESGEGAFTCPKAMVGTNDAGKNDANYSDGNTTIIIGNGTVGTLDTNGKLVEGTGTVYGGGEIGRVEMNTTVTIGLGAGVASGTPTSAPEIRGSVFGGGKGKETHGYAALVRGNPTVTIAGNAKVGRSVYGGGQIASVARYQLDANGEPHALVEINGHYSGYCTVNIGGYAEIGPNGMKMYHAGVAAGEDKPDDFGHVFGAGKGILPENYTYQGTDKPYRIDPNNEKEYYNSKEEYFAFIQTQALSSQTEVTISDHAFVKGSVYGGSENGLVQFDTHVTVSGGQIGAGEDMTKPYKETDWTGSTTPTDGWKECASWVYGLDTNSDNKKDLFAPYDPYANATGNLDQYSTGTSTEGGRRIATDGHTYYGNVFGGGSGSIPYFDNTLGQSVYLHSAGQVKGNTYVTISGGHILTNVYGGCEATNVSGTANVTMTDGTIGVPRSDDDIIAHPLTGYIFGAGKGDQRIFFNKDTNVENTVVTVEGGTIYGSVYGGGEDGHVMKNVTMTIGKDTDHGPTIGTRGTSYYDGNVFGGGRGFGGEALTAGNVGGIVTLNIEGGTMLGSVYGGGRLASVGYGLYLTTETGFGENQNDGYGVMQEDGYSDWTKGTNNEYTRTAISGFKRGYITVNVNGGTIGNDVADAEYGGNVFGASMGSLKKQDGTTDNDLWNLLATAKETRVNVTGGIIKRSVYGGGELGTVTTDAVVTVSGGTIGTSGNGGVEFGNVYGGGKGYVDPAGSNYITAGIIKGNTTVTINPSTTTEGEPSIYHNIYGGGAYGSVGTFTYDANNVITAHTANTGTANVTITGGTIGTNGHENGMVFGSSRGDVGAPGEIHDKLAWVYDTHVTIGTSGHGADSPEPQIKGSLYGSGENGHTYHDAEVIVHSGTIGMTTTPDADLTDDLSTDYDGVNYPYRGNVYGGGCGTDTYTYIENEGTVNEKRYKRYNHLAGIVRGQTTVLIDGGQVVHNVYGGGAMGSVGKIANYDDLDDTTKGYKHVASTTDGKTFFDFGLSWPYEFTYDASENANIGKTSVTITGSAVIGVSNSKGGHVFGAARGAVDVGTNDITEQRYIEAKLANVKETYVTIGEANGTATTPTIHGSVYGGGEDGHVYDNANVTIHHGTINHSVFGGGKGTSTFETTLWDPNNEGKDKQTGAEDVHSWIAGKVYGNTTVTINGGSVGYSVYGGGNLASVGKGNYAGGSDDYSTDGYGEWGTKVNDTGGPLWTGATTEGTYPYYFMNSGKATVTINGGTLGTAGVLYDDLPTGNVFGGSRGMAAASVQKSPRYRYVPDFFLGYTNETEVTIGGTSTVVYGSVYGGGQDGHVRRGTNVIINGGTIGDADQSRGGNIFGSGSGIGTYLDGETEKCNNSSGSVTCTTTITVNDGHVIGSVYGGGSLASVGPPHTGQGFDEYMTTDNYSTGDRAHGSLSYTQVNIKGGTIGGSVYGASRGPHDGMSETVKAFINSNEYNSTKFANVLWSNVNITGSANITGSVYGGGQKGLVKHATNVNIGTTGTGGAAFTGTISQDVFGGGKEAVVGGNVTVNMNSGTVNKSVYGGGALAHTNVNKTDATLTLTGAKRTTDEASATTTVNLYGGMIKGDAYGGGLGQLEVKSGETVTTEGIEAKVYGDVFVNQGKENDESKITAYTITYLTTDELQKDDNGNDIEGQYVKVVNSGRIFGCNNLNGSPQGNVTVTVNGTTTGKDANGGDLVRTAITRNTTTKEITSVATPHVYEVAAVYGGGNLADYSPTGGAVKVIINSCNVSVEEVYGGGNAAEVPATDVLVNGAHEIEHVFGGGNGEDKYTLDDGTTWIVNPGANVNGDTKTILKGGLIHEAYGGSNEKGTITGDIFIDTEDGGLTDCPLLLEKMVGAGKNADVNGNLIVVMGCKPSQKTPVFYAGADNANVNGDVELTITSGNFGKVFGGNNEGGAIMGHIIVNIEETGECSTPITIDELYLGGNNAAYSIYGYYVKTNETEAENGNGTGATTEHAILKNGKLQFMPRQSATDTHVPVKEYSYDESGVPSWTTSPITGEGACKPYAEPELNVVSCTRIDQVYGGGYGTGGTMYANPTVNINMIKGSFAENETKGVPAVMTAKGIDDSDNPQKLGIIGDVFGGGNAAVVMGNPTVNIGTATEVILHLSYDKTTIDETHDGYTYSGDPQTVLGAYIHGNVYGGGNLADVGYLDDDTKVNDPNSVYCNTNVNICAKEVTVESEQVWQSVAVGSGGVTIAGHVFGGGKGKDNTFKCEKAMIVGNTNVRIGNGTIKGDVYGGGEIGRVEQNTAVTIGLTSGTSAPNINGNVFGAGAGRPTHGYSALVRGNSTVIVQAGTNVGGSVYGGGEVATAGRYRIENDLPVETTGGGLCTVIVQGDAEITGNVFGAGQGVTPAYDLANYKNFKSMVTATNKPEGDENDTWDYYVDEDTHIKNENFVWKYYQTEADYLKFLQTLALASNTVVTIDGNAKVKKNVYGGSESGFVQDHTQVTTQGSCVIGTQTTTGESTTYTDGNVFGGGKGLASFAQAGIVKGTTTLLINNGTMYGNVYGGGELGSVGTYKISPDMRSFYWTNTPLADIDPEDYTYNDTGVCNVNIAGGTIGYTGVAMASDGSFANGNVFGAGKGLEDTFWCEKAIVYKANVSVTAGNVNGNVYGGGEVGRVETDAVVKIGPDEGTSTPDIKGNVFGGGAGVKTHGYSALVRGNTYVTVQSSAQVGHNVYGGGQIAAVGKYYLVDAAYKEAHPESNLEIGMPYSLVSDELGICNVTVIGSAAITGNVFGGGKGKEPETFDFEKPSGTDFHTASYDIDNGHMPKRMMNDYPGKNPYWEYYNPPTNTIIWEYFDTKEKYETFLETLGLTTQSRVTIGGTRDATTGTVTSSGSPTINGNVYGGSESGFVQHHTDVKIAGGTIGTTTAGGDVYGGGLGLATFAEAGRVRGNTNVTINAGTESGEPMIYHNVYGGGQLGDVGTINKTEEKDGKLTYNYKWTDEANPGTTYTWNNTGVCNVTITGGTIGTGVTVSDDGTYANGNVFGAGKGLEDTWWCEKAIAYKTNVTITDGLIKGTVYGGGQLGRVENDATVTIGTENEEGTGSKPNITGNVFGAGAGVKTHGYSALVRGNSNLTVQGIALVGGSVYGGGEIASVGRFTVVGGLPKHPDSGGTCTVTIKGHAKIGASGTGHNVFGACKGVTPAYNNTLNNLDRSKSMQLYENRPGDRDPVTGEVTNEKQIQTYWDYYETYGQNYQGQKFVWVYYETEADYLDFLETLALTSHPIVTIAEDATVNGSVFGGGERGITLGSVEVNMNGGTVTQDVYGGGSLANSNKGNWDGTDWATGKVVNGKTEYTTAVNLHSGIINGTVYGGGLGDVNTAALVYGDVTVKLNETIASDNCVVKGNIFGCNNVNGTPMGDVLVHVYKTQGWTDNRGTEDTSDDISHDQSTAKSTDADRTGERYELAAVYGGGNQAAYDPADADTRQTEVIIDGCDLTSIEYVYGGGNAAAAPATHVTVNSCYEIGTVFAGGNGAGEGNPGADVGLIKLKEGGTAYAGDPTKQSYGSGTALAELKGGTIHKAFGGSNTRGNVRESATIDLSEPSVVTCPLCVEEVYGAGNEADQDGTSNINLGCISFLSEIYGGAKNADVNSNVALTIQSGRFNRVFGGNNLGGCIRGSITVNIEETGCHPIVIGQLFGGGNKAGYSVRGYKQVTENGESVWKPREVNDGLESGMTTAYDDPQVNVKSFTSIGEIYGGGYGESAVIVGNTNVNVNVAVGENANMELKQETTTNPVTGEPTTTATDVSEHTGEWIHFGVDPDDPTSITTVWQPEHKRGEIGTIGNVFGGGNEAPVHGSTNIIIGNQETVTYISMTEEVDETDEQGNTVYESDGTTPKKKTVNVVKPVIGANITGNVYGGGNAADVTGDTNVIIGKEKPTTP